MERILKMMFSFFKKDKKEVDKEEVGFEVELTATVLAYEIARSDGDISDDELLVLMEEIEKIAIKVGKEKSEILKIVENYSKDSTSFFEFIEDINKEYTKDEKLALIKFLWDVAYADKILELNEERLIRRIADLIKIKDIDVLKLKDKSKRSND